MFVNQLSLESRVSEITRLEAQAQHSPNGDGAKLKTHARDTIKSILEQAMDYGTILYGLTALSGLGLTDKELREIATNYNRRVYETDKQHSPLFNFDPSYVRLIPIRDGQGGFREITVIDQFEMQARLVQTDSNGQLSLYHLLT